MSKSKHSEEAELGAAREFVRYNQQRLERTLGLADDVRHQAQAHLNELRQLIESVEIAQQDSSALGETLQTLTPWFDAHLDGKQKSLFREFVESAGLALLLALTLRAFVVKAFKIPSASMVPALLVGDHLFVNVIIYGLRIPFTQSNLIDFKEVERGEVVVFKFPGDQAREHLAKQPASHRQCIEMRTLDTNPDFIKRVIGVAGDTVEMRDNQVLINHKPIESLELRQVSTGNLLYPRQFEETKRLNGHTYTVLYSGANENFGPITVKPGHVFTMGDNRDNSSDGRCWGQVPLENIKGRASFIFASFGEDAYRWGRIGHWVD